MDLLGNYESDSDNSRVGDSQDHSVAPSPVPATSVSRSKSPPAAALKSGLVSAILPLPKAAAAVEGALPSPPQMTPRSQAKPRPRGSSLIRTAFGGEFGSLPELGGSKSGVSTASLGLSGRPKNVKLQTMKPLTTSSDEDDNEPSRKRLKPSTRSFLQSLPQPKHASRGALGSAAGSSMVHSHCC